MTTDDGPSLPAAASEPSRPWAPGDGPSLPGVPGDGPSLPGAPSEPSRPAAPGEPSRPWAPGERIELPGGFPPVEAPDALWQSMREQVLEQPDAWRDLAGDGRWLADWLWPEWADALEAREISYDHLAQVVAGYRQELWLWVMGERTWPHILTSLAGRLLRRSPSGSTTRS